MFEPNLRLEIAHAWWPVACARRISEEVGNRYEKVADVNMVDESEGKGPQIYKAIVAATKRYWERGVFCFHTANSGRLSIMQSAKYQQKHDMTVPLKRR